MPPYSNPPHIPHFPSNGPASMQPDMMSSGLFTQPFEGQPQPPMMPPGPQDGQSMFADAEMNKLMASLPPIPNIDASTFGAPNPSIDSIDKIVLEHEKFMSSLSQPQENQQEQQQLQQQQTPPEVKQQQLREDADEAIEEMTEERREEKITIVVEVDEVKAEDAGGKDAVAAEEKSARSPSDGGKAGKGDSAEIKADVENKKMEEEKKPSGTNVSKNTEAEGGTSQPAESNSEKKDSAEKKGGQKEVTAARKEVTAAQKEVTATPSESDEKTIQTEGKKVAELMERSQRWKKKIDAMAVGEATAEEAETEEAEASPVITAETTSGSEKPGEEEWEKVEDLKKTVGEAEEAEEEKEMEKVTRSKNDEEEKEDEWESVTKIRHSVTDEEEEEQWEKVTTVSLGKKKRATPISTEDKWENVNSEMKKVLGRRRQGEDDDDEEDEWKRVDVGEKSRNAVDVADEEEWVKLTDIK